MRAFLGIIAALALCATAEARPRSPHKKRVAEVATSRHGAHHAKSVGHRRRRELPPIPHGAPGQSIGQPWHGVLHDATRLTEGEGYHIRRPWRTYGTATTVGFVQRAIAETREAFPELHVLAVGDLSQKGGGEVTDHHSHQSGRDVDIGLLYKQQPADYPREFVAATAANLDCAATWALIAAFAATAPEDGGAQVMFLDFGVQGILYRWGQAHDIDEELLDRVFQYPHGRTNVGLVRHEPHHLDHVHVRFKCVADDKGCG
jgi:murein endopeptidase